MLEGSSGNYEEDVASASWQLDTELQPRKDRCFLAHYRESDGSLQRTQRPVLLPVEVRVRVGRSGKYFVEG